MRELVYTVPCLGWTPSGSGAGVSAPALVQLSLHHITWHSPLPSLHCHSPACSAMVSGVHPIVTCPSAVTGNGIPAKTSSPLSLLLHFLLFTIALLFSTFVCSILPFNFFPLFQGLFARVSWEAVLEGKVVKESWAFFRKKINFLFKKCLHGQAQRVVVNGATFSWHRVTSGVLPKVRCQGQSCLFSLLQDQGEN